MGRQVPQGRALGEDVEDGCPTGRGFADDEGDDFAAALAIPDDVAAARLGDEGSGGLADLGVRA